MYWWFLGKNITNKDLKAQVKRKDISPENVLKFERKIIHTSRDKFTNTCCKIIYFAQKWNHENVVVCACCCGNWTTLCNAYANKWNECPPLLMFTKYFICNTKQKTDCEASQDNKSASLPFTGPNMKAWVFGGVPFSSVMLTSGFSCTGTVLRIFVFLEIFWKWFLQIISNFVG